MQKSERRWSGAFLGAFLVLAGFLGAYITAGHMVIGYMASYDWVEVPVDLRRIELVRHRDSVSGRTTRKLEGAYVYQFDGTEYRSDRMSLVYGSDDIGSYWPDLYHKIVALYKVNEVVAYVNPENAAEAVLDRTLRIFHIIIGLLFLIVFCGFGIAFLSSSLRVGKKQADDISRFKRRGMSSNPVVEKNTRYIDIRGGVLRNIGSGLIGTGVGVILSGIGYFSVKDGWVPGFIFLLIGVFIIGFTLFIIVQKLARKIEVKIDRQARVLHIRRKWFGIISFFDRGELIEPKQLFVKEISKGQRNAYYVLRFNANRKIYTISGWIDGRKAADRLLREIVYHCFEADTTQQAA